MSAEPVAPAEPPAGADGFGPESLGHRIPAIKIPGKIAAQVARLTMVRAHGEPPLVPEAELLALLAEIGDRYTEARAGRESFTATIEARVHEGRHREFAWTERRRLTPPRP